MEQKLIIENNSQGFMTYGPVGNKPLSNASAGLRPVVLG